MKKKISIFIAAILFVNLTLWSSVTVRNYSYTNQDGTYADTEMSGMGGDFEAIKLGYARFLRSYPEKDKADNKLYRTFTIQP